MSFWLLIITIGVVTYSIRLSSIVVLDRATTKLPPLVQTALRFVPPAVLSAIFVPELVQPGGKLDISLGNARLLSGLLAILVAWRTRSVLLTIVVGMGALWLLSALPH